MPDRPDSTPPPWNESDSIRETTLIWIDSPEDREALRQAGRVLCDLAVEVSRAMGGESSMTRAELRAVAADLRYSAGYCAAIGRQAQESTLEPDDDALSHFAGRLAGHVGNLAAAIERTLSRRVEP
jgi:hypothetical protein